MARMLAHCEQMQLLNQLSGQLPAADCRWEGAGKGIRMVERSADAGAPRRRPRLRGWWLLATLAGGFLLAIALTFALIVWLSGDLRPVLAEAKRRGFAVSAAELGVGVTPGHAAMQARLRVLRTALKQYQMYGYDPAGSYRLGEPGAPRSEGLVQHQAAIDPAATAEVLAIVDALAGAPLQPQPLEPLGSWAVSETGTLFDTLHGRFAAAQTGEGREAVRLLWAANALPIYWSPNLYRRASRIDQALRLIAGRLDDLRGDQQVIAAITASVADFASDLRRASRGDFALLAELVTLDADDCARSRGYSLPRIFEWPGVLRVTNRLGRVGLLRRELEAVIAIDADPGQPLAPLVARCFPKRLNPEALLTHAFHGWVTQVASLDHLLPRLHMRAELLCAELGGGAWPVDRHAPAGTTLRRLERDGRLIAAYSVGRNGVDDGGTSGVGPGTSIPPCDDLVFPLYGRIEKGVAYTTAPGR